MKLPFETNTLKKTDPLIFFAVVPLLIMGVLFIESADGPARASKQLMWIGVGLGVFAAVASYDYLKLLKASSVLYVITLLSLVALLMLPPMVKGNSARSWFRIRGFSIQPSELMKIFVVLVMAHYLMYRRNYRRMLGLVVPFLLALVPMVLVLKQPDLGSAVIFVPIAFAMLYVAAARLKHLLAVVGMGLGVSFYGWFYVLSPYQKMRIESWQNPEKFLGREAYQLLASLMSIGTGCVTGKGRGSGIMSKVVPENHTDFIFSVIAEEWGFIGSMFLLACFFLLLVAGVGIALRTREPAGRLIAAGIVALFAAEIIINLYVAMGFFPTTGIALPFVSYGGSSMVSSFFALGLLANVGAKQYPVFADDDFSG